MSNQVSSDDVRHCAIPDIPCAEEDSSKIPDVTIVESSAELLYGLVHQRFILTKAGLSAMVSTRSLFLRGLCECRAHPRTAGQVRERSFRELPSSLLPMDARLACWTIRYARDRYCQAVLSELWGPLHSSKQQVFQCRW